MRSAFPGRAISAFLLAFLSFACLLGEFYGLWTMHIFGCWVLPPAAALLAWIAYGSRGRPSARSNPHTWIVHGTLGGLVAAVVYDLYRLPFVLAGAPLFRPFPRFGALLLGREEPAWAVQTLGWLYHFSNGAALGIMFLSLASFLPRLGLLWGALAWALIVEAALLATPYPSFFGLPFNGMLVFLTLTAHIIFGVTLGCYCRVKVTA